jgi:cytochrome c556
MKKKLIIATLLASTVLAASAGPIEDQIKIRQSAYSFLGWNTAKIKSQVVDKPETYNKEQVIAAANVIAAISNSGLGALYGVGTDQGNGWKQTRLKPEFFSKPEEAKKIATDFNREANEFAKVAETGDINEIKSKFGKLSESCKSCHDNFRIREQH